MCLCGWNFLHIIFTWIITGKIIQIICCELVCALTAHCSEPEEIHWMSYHWVWERQQYSSQLFHGSAVWDSPKTPAFNKPALSGDIKHCCFPSWSACSTHSSSSFICLNSNACTPQIFFMAQSPVLLLLLRYLLQSQKKWVFNLPSGSCCSWWPDDLRTFSRKIKAETYVMQLTMQCQPQHQRVQSELQKISSNVVAPVSMPTNMGMLPFIHESDSTDMTPRGKSYV